MIVQLLQLGTTPGSMRQRCSAALTSRDQGHDEGAIVLSGASIKNLLDAF